MKKIASKVFSRAVFTGAFILLQIGALALGLRLLNHQFQYFYAGSLVVSALLVLYIVNRNGSPAYKIAWIIPIMLTPVFGGLLYLVFGKNRLSKRERKRMEQIGKAYRQATLDSTSMLDGLLLKSPEAGRQAAYIANVTGTPLFHRTETTFLPVGETMYLHLMEELKKAQKFVFIEFYIIEQGKMWDGIHQVLLEKVRQGVDVRVLYDDFGTMFRLPDRYDKILCQEGIDSRIFNRFQPVLSPRFNNRDHRKICVIDGVVGFTGGINIADRYINQGDFSGHWLDSGILLRGGGVWGLTMMFLAVWDFCADKAEDMTAFLPDPSLCTGLPENGYVMPFTDTPLDDEALGATVYQNLIHRATQYVYINTPYLIIDQDMILSLTTVAKSGVDVRLVTPALCDGKLVQEMTRSYYKDLIAAGVKIYEYTPGMVHAKTFVCDDRYGVVGTINLDYRSLYLHFECAVWMYETSAVLEMKRAYLDELTHCQRVTMERNREQSRWKRLYRAVLRLFAPLF